jgi:DNA-binding GntR family transcriptional regulator
MGAVLLHGESRDGIWDEHEAICAAISAGDSALAGRLSEGHADSARQSLVRSLEATLQPHPHAA